MAEPATNIETTTAVRIARWIEQEKRTNAIKGIDPARADLETEAYPPDMCTSFRHQTDCVQEKQTRDSCRVKKNRGSSVPKEVQIFQDYLQ